MSALETLRGEIEEISPVDEREASSIAATLDRLTWPVDPYDEELDDHHLTASSFVISSRGVILHRHRRLGIWGRATVSSAGLHHSGGLRSTCWLTTRDF